MSGILYIVSTPIGNPEDISLRALRVLREVPLIAAENAPVTRRLLQHYGISTEVVSYRLRHKPEERFHALLASDQAIALVCDAGTPTLADPGSHLIQAALGWGAKVVPVPGVSAALTGLVVSNLCTGRFAFDGFPPRARADRQAFFASLKSETRTLVLYETRPYLRSTLQALAATLGAERRIVIARNLTLPSETLFRGDLAAALSYLQPEPPRGEFVLILASPDS